MRMISGFGNAEIDHLALVNLTKIIDKKDVLRRVFLFVRWFRTDIVDQADIGKAYREGDYDGPSDL